MFVIISLKRIYVIAKKEYISIKKNKLYLVMTFLGPIIIFLPLAYGLRLDVDNIPLGVCDMDNSNESRQLIDDFVNSGYFNLKKYTNNYDLMEKDLQKGNLKVIIIIPDHFEKDVVNGTKPEILFLIDGVIPQRAEVANTYINGIIHSHNIKVTKKLLNYKGDVIQKPINVLPEIWFNETLDTRNYVVPPLIAVILYFFPPLLSAITIVKEKETRSIIIFFCSPITKTEYIIGKIITYSFITYFDFLSLFIMLKIFFPMIPIRGNLIVFLILSFFYCIATTSIGIVISVMMEKQVNAIMLCFIGTMLPAFNYSGMFRSVESMDIISRTIAYFMPVTYYVSSIRQIFLKSGGIEVLLGYGLIFLAFSLCLPVFAIILLKKRL